MTCGSAIPYDIFVLGNIAAGFIRWLGYEPGYLHYTCPNAHVFAKHRDKAINLIRHPQNGNAYVTPMLDSPFDSMPYLHASQMPGQHYVAFDYMVHKTAVPNA